MKTFRHSSHPVLCRAPVTRLPLPPRWTDVVTQRALDWESRGLGSGPSQPRSVPAPSRSGPQWPHLTKNRLAWLRGSLGPFLLSESGVPLVFALQGLLIHVSHNLRQPLHVGPNSKDLLLTRRTERMSGHPCTPQVHSWGLGVGGLSGLSPRMGGAVSCRLEVYLTKRKRPLALEPPGAHRRAAPGDSRDERAGAGGLGAGLGLRRWPSTGAFQGRTGPPVFPGCPNAAGLTVGAEPRARAPLPRVHMRPGGDPAYCAPFPTPPSPLPRYDH